MRVDRSDGMISRRGWMIAFILLLGCAVARGQDSLRVDSLKVYRGAVVVVERESILPRVTRSTQPLAVVTRGEIEAANAVDLSDAVAFSPGVFVKQYGGLGGLRTISLRGTSAQQSIILIDGIRYRSSAAGAFDLSNLAADMIERVEVVRGGNATLYGANALGGVVNLITRSSSEHPLRGTLRAGRGSYGEQTYGIALDGASGGHLWDGGAHMTSAAGDYPFTFNEYGATSTVRRQNADFSNLHARLGWSYAGDGLRLTFNSQGFRSERGVPGGVVQGSHEQLRARLEENDLFASAGLACSWDEWGATFSASGRLNGLRYRDPDARLGGPFGINNYYDGREAALVARLRRSIGEEGLIEGAVELLHASLSGDNLDPAVGSWVERTQGSFAASGSWFFEQGLFGWETAIDGGVRGDYFSDIEPAVSPAFGVVQRLGSLPLRMRAHVALAYRTPSFTEQYYLNTGNRDLRPERAVSYNVGLTCELWESFAIEGGGFLIRTRNQIITIPRSPVSWTAANIAAVESRGIELALAGTLLDGLLDLRSSYTLMRAEDRSGGRTDGNILVYSPQELFNGIAAIRIDRYQAGLSWQYVSHRYTLPLNVIESSLPHYWIIGGNASARWAIDPVDLTLRIECSNLFDARYQVVRNYPMPGRIARAEVVVRYGGRGGG